MQSKKLFGIYGEEKIGNSTKKISYFISKGKQRGGKF